MRKKRVAMMLGFALMLSLSGCTNKDTKQSETEPIERVEITRASTEEQETTNVPIHSEDKLIVETVSPGILVEGTDGKAIYIGAGQDPDEIEDPIARENYKSLLGIETDTDDNKENESTTEPEISESDTEIESKDSELESKSDNTETISDKQLEEINDSIREFTKKQAEEWDANMDDSTLHKVK